MAQSNFETERVKFIIISETTSDMTFRSKEDLNDWLDRMMPEVSKHRIRIFEIAKEWKLKRPEVELVEVK